ncbi:MAG: aminopeptidase P family protein [Oscillospiraceae bacterium]|nr:aminopeptidase P family protein [Oscillospiraceae bacterium]
MNRIEKLIAKLPENCDGAIVFSMTNRGYLTEFMSSDGTLLVFRDGAFFITDSRYIEIARKKVKGAEVILQGKLADQVAEICKDHGVKELIVEQELTLAQFSMFREALADIRLLDGPELSDAIKGLRAVKEPGEIEMICAAQDITDRAFLEILNYIRPGVTEKQVAAELEYYMRRLGADGLAFGSIVASGENGSMPHAVPSDRKIRKGDLVTMDFGAKLGGYCSDMTRTIAVGQIKDEQLKIYNTVLEAHLTSMAAAKAGCSGKALDAIARGVIDAAGYGSCFGHSLGHSLGLDVHESPMCTPSRDYILPAGTIMTIEPGIYVEGKWGVRIENMILVTEDGYRNLTGSERALITLD